MRVHPTVQVHCVIFDWIDVAKIWKVADCMRQTRQTCSVGANKDRENPSWSSPGWQRTLLQKGAGKFHLILVSRRAAVLNPWVANFEIHNLFVDDAQNELNGTVSSTVWLKKNWSTSMNAAAY